MSGRMNWDVRKELNGDKDWRADGFRLPGSRTRR